MLVLNVGFGNVISANRIISIINPEAAPIKRMIQEAKDGKTVIDATCGRRTRAVIVMDSGHIVLSSLQPETLTARLDSNIISETN